MRGAHAAIKCADGAEGYRVTNINGLHSSRTGVGDVQVASLGVVTLRRTDVRREITTHLDRAGWIGDVEDLDGTATAAAVIVSDVGVVTCNGNTARTSACANCTDDARVLGVADVDDLQLVTSVVGDVGIVAVNRDKPGLGAGRQGEGSHQGRGSGVTDVVDQKLTDGITVDDVGVVAFDIEAFGCVGQGHGTEGTGWYCTANVQLARSRTDTSDVDPAVTSGGGK